MPRLAACANGATAIEYSLVAALIAVAAIVAFQGLGNEIQTTFSSVESKVGATV